MNEQKKNPLAEREKEILKFWQDNKIFEKTLQATEKGERYTFYDGPPFATGTPHYGHLVASIMKDVVPRYQTMKGRYVERKWGWDCHGLPVENLIEQELGLKDRKDIEKIGIEKFNGACRSSVLRYVDDWKKTIPRLGRWVDMENDYRTMEPWYMESIWWAFKELWQKELIYEGYKSMHICPRCETTLSNFEVTQGYKDVKDLSVTAKFKVKNDDLNVKAGLPVNTFILAWTTTPWTLVGNVALAVGKDIEYVLVESRKSKVESQGKNSPVPSVRDGATGQAKNQENLILAKERLSQVEGEYEVIKGFKGSELVGLKYEPLFDYYLDQDLPNKENLYVVVDADFVSTGDGTGVVHIAPAFGEEDMILGQEKCLSFIQHVDMSGHFKPEVKDFVGLEVKPKEDIQKTDVEIIKYLGAKGLLFAKEKYEHSYPHCWRCDTPLLNYATSSWFVKVTTIKSDLIANNQKINWVPKHIKDGRFGKWLEESKDWAISRSRYWGAPLPVWRCDTCDETKVIGSMKELDENRIKKGNFYFIRHLESEKNVQHIFDSSKDRFDLSDKGITQAKALIKKINTLEPDVIISSKVLRAKRTADIIAEALGLNVITDARLNEVNFGQWEGQSDETAEANQMVEKYREEYDTVIPGGESYANVEKRMVEFYADLQKNYSGKKVLVISHGDTIRALDGRFQGFKASEIYRKVKMLKNGEIAELVEKTNDLHKEFVDKIFFSCTCGGKMKRIPEVLDCWFESGSMPFARYHYPFENKEKFEQSFPADFIAEGTDQTRGWFYTMLVLSTALFGREAYKNVIANGIVLAEDGKKMSKRLKNYPEPDLAMEEFGADAIRYYLLSSPVMSAENLSFSPKEVKEAMQKVIMLLNNIFNFFKLYQTEKVKDKKPHSKNILDEWLLAKLEKLIKDVTVSMDNYDLSRAVRPIQSFIDEFSTWWLRRSRDRFKGDDKEDKESALNTFGYALLTLSKVMAPFMPFNAEFVYREIGGGKESVHLESWPVMTGIDEKIIEQMDQARKVVEMGLAERSQKGVKIRQPLAKLTVYGQKLTAEFAELIADEINVKEVLFVSGTEIKVELDTVITEELKKEGVVREIVRTINGLRRDAGLTIKDRIKIFWQSEGFVVKSVLADDILSAEIKKSTLTDEIINKENESKEVDLNGEMVRIMVEKIG